MKLFGATTITRKIILEGGLAVVDDGSRIGSGIGAAVGANNAPLTVFKITSHYDYGHNGCTDFSLDFAISSECFVCKSQGCKAKHDGVINVINKLTTSVKEMTSKRDVIPSKKISYPDTLLEIKVDVTVEATAEEHNITVDNPSTASKEKEKMEPAKFQIQEQYRYTTSNYLYKVYINNSYDRYCQQHLKVSRNEECLINIIKGFSSPAGLPWHLVDEVYIPINCGDEFHWVLAVVVLKKRCIRVYDSMSRRRRSEPSSEIQKLAKILPTYLDISRFLNQKVRTNWLTIEAYRDKMDNPFELQYVKGIAQQTIGSLDCGPVVAAYAEYLSDGLQVPNNGLDTDYSVKDMLLFYGNTEK
ncbi:hypothetical protein CQW23_21528 [Capsicum baccatum]|uniref:Ubiquitin-like protease family profile domain-containing protein n=1 Tax=Capsicum baccatum TaxID=33114 RepID=A0A2G2VYA4_CAPBA|nr:hypothetical protein CQW23_21528 [Capsicum baccatum]